MRNYDHEEKMSLVNYVRAKIKNKQVYLAEHLQAKKKSII